MAESSATDTVLVLDFDGTVCLGDAPVLGYAAQLISRIASPRSGDSLRESLAQFLAETDWFANAKKYPESVRGASDGYALASALARDAGLSSAEINAAYLASRQALARGELETFAPPGLADFLASLPAVLILVTNAPIAGITAQLRQLGIAGQIDRVIANAGKPQGMTDILQKIFTEHQVSAGRVLSVGDIWRNDLEPAWLLGCATAHIDRHGAREGSPDFRAERFELLYPQLLRWAQGR